MVLLQQWNLLRIKFKFLWILWLSLLPIMKINSPQFQGGGSKPTKVFSFEISSSLKPLKGKDIVGNKFSIYNNSQRWSYKIPIRKVVMSYVWRKFIPTRKTLQNMASKTKNCLLINFSKKAIPRLLPASHLDHPAYARCTTLYSVCYKCLLLFILIYRSANTKTCKITITIWHSNDNDKMTWQWTKALSLQIPHKY